MRKAYKVMGGRKEISCSYLPFHNTRTRGHSVKLIPYTQHRITCGTHHHRTSRHRAEEGLKEDLKVRCDNSHNVRRGDKKIIF